MALVAFNDGINKLFYAIRKQQNKITKKRNCHYPTPRQYPPLPARLPKRPTSLPQATDHMKQISTTTKKRREKASFSERHSPNTRKRIPGKKLQTRPGQNSPRRHIVYPLLPRKITQIPDKQGTPLLHMRRTTTDQKPHHPHFHL